jgi:SPIRAL1-like protein
MSTDDVRASTIVKGMTIKDLRFQCRARSISPAGGKEALADRLMQHMLETKDL